MMLEPWHRNPEEQQRMAEICQREGRREMASLLTCQAESTLALNAILARGGWYVAYDERPQ